MNNIYYLSHGGPGSGRYPLGSGDRPFQKFEGGIRGYVSKKKAEKEEIKKLRKLYEEKALLDDKERVLQSGTANEVLKYKGTLTKKELNDAYNRLNLERLIGQISDSDKVNNEQRIDNIVSKIKKTTDWVVAGVVAYNTMAIIYNNFGSTKLPTIKYK